MTSDPQHLRDWIVLVDGARHQLDLIQAEAGRFCLWVAVSPVALPFPGAIGTVIPGTARGAARP